MYVTTLHLFVKLKRMYYGDINKIIDKQWWRSAPMKCISWIIFLVTKISGLNSKHKTSNLELDC